MDDSAKHVKRAKVTQNIRTSEHELQVYSAERMEPYVIWYIFGKLGAILA